MTTTVNVDNFGQPTKVYVTPEDGYVHLDVGVEGLGAHLTPAEALELIGRLSAAVGEAIADGHVVA